MRLDLTYNIQPEYAYKAHIIKLTDISEKAVLKIAIKNNEIEIIKLKNIIFEMHSIPEKKKSQQENALIFLNFSINNALKCVKMRENTFSTTYSHF